MKIYLTLPLLSLATFALTQCVVDQNGSIPGTYGDNSAVSNASGPRGFSQPLSASTGTGSVTVREGGRVLSSISTASPNVEETRWHREQEQIVVKSRGNHGPATVQLFDSRSGRELGRVMAYDIAGGKPKWAAGMGE
jgi:hypothetical protein